LYSISLPAQEEMRGMEMEKEQNGKHSFTFRKIDQLYVSELQICLVYNLRLWKKLFVMELSSCMSQRCSSTKTIFQLSLLHFSLKCLINEEHKVGMEHQCFRRKGKYYAGLVNSKPCSTGHVQREHYVSVNWWHNYR